MTATSSTCSVIGNRSNPCRDCSSQLASSSDPEVTCERSGIAGDVHEPPGTRIERGERADDRPAGAFAGGVEHHEIRRAEPPADDGRA